MEVVRPDLDFALDDLEDLHDILQAMRQEHGPVVKVNFVGKPLWLINSYETVLQGLSDEEHLSCPEAYKLSIGKTMGTVIATMKGKQHRLNRAIVSNVFFPKAMRALSETVFREEAEKLVENISCKLSNGEHVELMQEYTKPLTFNIITRLLGLPVEDQDKLVEWADLIMASWDMDNALRGRKEITEYLQPVINERRNNPGDDFISMLVTARIIDDGNEEGLTDEEIFSFIRNLFPAGIDTSSKSMGSLLAVLLSDPELKAFTLQSSENCDITINELLRWQPPLSMVPRRCVKDIELGGRLIREGDMVMLGIAGGNSDPATFDNPQVVNPHREAKILSFGHGEHYCLGTHMAKRVLETGVMVLLTRIPELSIVKDRPVVYVHGVLRGPRELWVEERCD